jgi:hypothetical protein
MERAGIWIPERIWQLRALSMGERIFLAEVASFIDTGRECFASDDYFAERLQCSEQQARKILLQLVRLGFIERDGYGATRKLRISAQVPDGSCAYTRKNLRTDAQKLRTDAQKVAPKRAHMKQDIEQPMKQHMKQGDVEVVMPFDSQQFQDAWSEWKEYRKAEHRFQYRSAKTEQTALHNLQKISNNGENAAIAIIGQSIANGWRGLFELRGPNLTRTGFTRHLQANGAGTNTPLWHQHFTGQ